MMFHLSGLVSSFSVKYWLPISLDGSFKDQYKGNHRFWLFLGLLCFITIQLGHKFLHQVCTWFWYWNQNFIVLLLVCFVKNLGAQHLQLKVSAGPGDAVLRIPITCNVNSKNKNDYLRLPDLSGSLICLIFIILTRNVWRKVCAQFPKLISPWNCIVGSLDYII